MQYDDKLKLVALTQQATHGKLIEENLSPLGALDVIGKDRRNAWQALGDMSQDEAMFNFLESVGEIMPHLKPYFEAIKNEQESCIF